MTHKTEAGISGALACSILGVAARQPGIVAGAIIGGAAGAIVGAVLDSESSR